MSDAWCVSLSRSVWTIGIGLRPLWPWWKNMVRWCQTLDSYSPVRVPQLYIYIHIYIHEGHLLDMHCRTFALMQPILIQGQLESPNPERHQPRKPSCRVSWLMEKTDTLIKLSLVWLILQECPTKRVRKCQGLCVNFKNVLGQFQRLR